MNRKLASIILGIGIFLGISILAVSRSQAFSEISEIKGPSLIVRDGGQPSIKWKINKLGDRITTVIKVDEKDSLVRIDNEIEESSDIDVDIDEDEVSVESDFEVENDITVSTGDEKPSLGLKLPKIKINMSPMKKILFGK